MGASAGTYALVVSTVSPVTLEVGRLGRVRFGAGLFCYIGSALGPGGLRSRLRRYAIGPRRLHWHIDYLLDHALVVGALVRENSVRLECSWARWFAGRCETPIDGFGASDCRCGSHLFFLGAAQTAEQILETAGWELKAPYVDRTSLTGER